MLTYTDLSKITKQMLKCRQASAGNEAALVELENLHKLITNISNEMTAQSCKISRQITSIETSIAALRETTFGQRQA